MIEINPTWILNHPSTTLVLNSIEELIPNVETVEREPNSTEKPKNEQQSYYTSAEYLNALLSHDTPLNTNECSVLEYVNISSNTKIRNELNRVIGILWNKYRNHSIQPTGNFLYPPGGFMGWHTNYKHAGIRMYMSYVKESNKSGFLYYDGERVQTSLDTEGWTIRIFDTSSIEQPLWHSVFSNTNRYSFGFTITPL